MSKTSLIVGASSDIGKAVMEKLDGAGNRIIAHGCNNLAALESMQACLQSDLHPLRADLSDPDSCDVFIQKAVALCANPDHLVFAQAPRLTLTRLKKLSRQQVMEQLEVQMVSSMTIAKAFLPAMVKRGNGRVVFVLSSVTLGMPPAAMADYNIAKYAQLGLMRSLAAEFGTKGVRVNAVSPSMVDTPFLQDIPDNMVIQNAAAHPMRRNATSEEVASAVVFMLSDGAEYINGVNLSVTGGECV
ncbi:SDR family NAD(P)-dependent oxidoreductase [Enterovibrio calviensis]|uniref:SDR family NAD(P)-dependent oxidoreductase n=1 Tax=Enterovibrio calviensis TaxID=91359 RepID=UPI0004837148|nr:SDR family oxidoreductase [Enterovibrio calviensis]